MAQRKPPTLQKLFEQAAQVCSICSDWNLDEIEVDGKMVSAYDLKKRFEAAAVRAGELEARMAGLEK